MCEINKIRCEEKTRAPAISLSRTKTNSIVHLVLSLDDRTNSKNFGKFCCLPAVISLERSSIDSLRSFQSDKYNSRHLSTDLFVADRSFLPVDEGPIYTDDERLDRFLSSIVVSPRLFDVTEQVVDRLALKDQTRSVKFQKFPCRESRRTFFETFSIK